MLPETIATSYPGKSAEPTVEDQKDLCGGEDLISLPAKDGTPFQLYIRYPKRSRSERGYVYSGDSFANYRYPTLVEYNLFTLQADHVSYDAKLRKLVAIGQVLVADESGVTRQADSVIIKIGNGQAVPVQ